MTSKALRFWLAARAITPFPLDTLRDSIGE